MGMAASQARFLGLTARKTNVEYEGQQINQQRTALGNQSANYYNQMLGMSVPIPPSVDDYTKTVYSFADGSLSNSITSLIAKGSGLYSVSYLREWQDDFALVSAETPIVTNSGGNYYVGAQKLRSLGDEDDFLYHEVFLTNLHYNKSTGFYTDMQTAQAANTNPAYDKFFVPANEVYAGQNVADAYRAAADGSGTAADALNSFVVNLRAIVLEAQAAGSPEAAALMSAVTMTNSVPQLGQLTYADGTPTLLGKWTTATQSYRNSAYSGGMDEYYRILQAMVATFYDPNPSDLNAISGTYNGIPVSGSGNLITGTHYSAPGVPDLYYTSKVYTDPSKPSTSYTSSTGTTVTLSRDVVMTRNNQALAQTMGEITIKLLEKDADGNYVMLASKKPEEFQPGYFTDNDGNPLSTNIIRLISNYERDAAGNVIYENGNPKLKSMFQKTVDVYALSTSSLFGVTNATRSNSQLVTDAGGTWVTDLSGEKIYRTNSTAEYIDFSNPATIAKLDAAVNAGQLYRNGSNYTTPGGETIRNGYLVYWSGNVPHYVRWGNAYNTSSGLPFGNLEANLTGAVHNDSDASEVSFMGLLKSFESDFAYNLWLDEIEQLREDWENNPDASLYDRLPAAERQALFLDIADKIDAFMESIKPVMIPIAYIGDNEYYNTLSPEEQVKLFEQEKINIDLLNSQYGKHDWMVRYVKNSATGAYEPVFYNADELKKAVYDQNGHSRSYIQAYRFGSAKKHEEVKNVPARIEQDSTGRIINITLNPGQPNEVTHALTTNTITNQRAYDDAMNQYEFDKYQYDLKIQEVNAKIKIIHVEDRNLELRLKQLDTEQNAIQTEMDAVSKIIEKNVESTFKTFG
ncbi:MAG: hypothetical protein LBK53_00210 [Heliobacteriaceae bacterium]|jgi:hypothetical protein|nr:hypothetical protein [Heliobacteriaceae bacterium]